MSRKPKLTKAQLKVAIRASRGIVTEVARRLGVDRRTIYKYLKKFPDLQEALDDEREVVLDIAEASLFNKAIGEGDTKCLMFLLESLGRSRGYSRRHEITGLGGEPLSVVYQIGGEESDGDQSD